MPLELQPLPEGSESLTPLDVLLGVDAHPAPALYPSPDTFPSLATFPSEGGIVPARGLFLDPLAEDTQTLTPLLED